MSKDKNPKHSKGNKPSNGSDAGRKDFHKAIREARNMGRLDVIALGFALYVISKFWKGNSK